MDQILFYIAKLYIFIEGSFKFILLFMAVMATLWILRVLKDPAKQFDLAMDLFKNIFVWTWKVIMFFWMGVLWLFGIISSMFSVTFATIRDFFTSKN